MSKIPIKIDGYPGLDVVDRDHIRATVDGEPEIFSRTDRYYGHPLSGLAHFGPAQGDWRCIRAIADDVQDAFRLLDQEIQRINPT